MKVCPRCNGLFRNPSDPSRLCEMCWEEMGQMELELGEPTGHCPYCDYPTHDDEPCDRCEDWRDAHPPTPNILNTRPL